MTTGINDSTMIPRVDGALYGNFQPPKTEARVTLTHPLVTDVAQTYDLTLIHNFFIYADLTRGASTYLVVCIEEGVVSPGNLLSDQFLTGANNRDHTRDPDLAKGFFHHRIDCRIACDTQDQGIVLSNSSPSNSNARTAVTNQTVSSYTDTVTVGTDSASGSVSSGTQIWASASFDITEWNILDESDAGAGVGKWIYYQDAGTGDPTSSWDGRNDPSLFSQWWEQAFFMGGGWDNVKTPPVLSRNTLKFSNIAAWRIQQSLVRNGKLQLTFSGSADVHAVLVCMPQFRDNGHHNATGHVISAPWSHTFDVVEWAAASSRK